MHIQPLVKTLQQAYSGEAAKRYVGEISRHHRIQASPGYRAAANWLVETLQEAGLAVTVERYPATEEASFWTLPSFQEWDCRTATLDWLRAGGDERLCDYRASAVSVVQRSVSVQGEFAVVDAGDGLPENYAGLDVAGKLVLSRSPIRETYQLAVIERDAAGVLFDHIAGDAPGRSRTDLPDTRQYASFWWQPEDEKSWGFVLTPRQGDTLRATLNKGETVTLGAHIDARHYDGEFEVILATIPGQTDKSVLGMAHLCHPQGFANDNASGAACLLETATTLQRLLHSGELPQPQRTLHFLWIPEMTGTYAWLEAHEARIPTIVAGLNLDMVGEDQEKTGAVMVIDRPPESLTSFAPDLLERLREELFDEQSNLSGIERYPLFRYASTGFSGGSDHMITSDPAVGIPTPMLIQWPDRFYHTTSDTLDNVDPKSLWRAGVVAGSYLYWLAQAGEREATWLGWELVSRYERRLSQYIQDQTTLLLGMEHPSDRARAWRQIQKRASYRQGRALAAIETLQRLSEGQSHRTSLQPEIEEITDRALDRSRRQIRPITLPMLHPEPDAWHERADQFIPERLYRGPIMDMAAPLPLFTFAEADAAAWRKLYAEDPDWRTLRVFAEYWADGQRSLAEIADLVELETGRVIGPAIETYFRLLEKAGVMRIRRRTQ
ncbi:MAG: DUF4910 domain-containing protein [Chloroflexi bacterium]|nr:DUF4910 domain-containing protein [Chloroflexota bacterium]